MTICREEMAVSVSWTGFGLLLFGVQSGMFVCARAQRRIGEGGGGELEEMQQSKSNGEEAVGTWREAVKLNW